MRDLKYWENEDDPEIILQIKRTISETKKEPSFTKFARSSSKAYELKLNKHVFHYWANQPMKLTLIHPFKNYKYPKIEFKDLEETKRMSNEVYFTQEDSKLVLNSKKGIFKKS